MINIEEIIQQLTSNAEAIKALLKTISEEQALWKPGPETWSLQDVIEHVYNEERIDFKKHLKEMLNVPPKPWGRFNRAEFLSIGNCQQILQGFLSERGSSLKWLKSLESPDWNIKSPAPYGPSDSPVVLSTGDILVSWVEHDYLHVRQIIELLHAWNVKRASPYSVDYAGGW
jgi:hypothetical protein